MNTRNWSIRSKIIALVMVPLVALLALWIFATALTAGPAVNLLSAQTLLDGVGKPGEAMVAELQHERRLSVVYLAGRGSGAELATQRSATDLAIVEFRRAASSNDTRDAAGELLRSRIGQLVTALDGLPAGRGQIDRREIDPAGAQGLYDSTVDAAFAAFTATATFDDPEIDRQIRALTTLGRAREWLSRADSLLAGALAAGRFTGEESGRLIQVIGTQRYLYAEAVADLPTSERTAYQRLTEGDAFVRLRQLQDALAVASRAGAPAPVTAASWQPAYDSAVQQLRAFEINATESLADRAAPVAVDVLVRLALAGVVGLAAVVVSVIVSVRVGRSLIGRLVRLRAAALEVAGERLPAVVRRLQRGESVDVDAEAPPLDDGTDEIGQLGRAFSEVQRTAVRSAVDEAGLRRGMNDVFLNIARRSQSLLHRQLALLDRMERRVTSPDELEDLYRVDHLATRMRRHAEDLVILAGAAPGRGWRNPVPVIDVIRGAISEVEDYKRIDVRAVEASSVVGRAVGDVIHLLAELLENAASFSPPRTRVQVAGQPVPNGYAIEIEDRGLGMTPEALADVNRRLLEPPEFDPTDSARLGLFVVARLATRHGIRVQLRPSPYGGVTAVTLIPADLITLAAGPVALTAGPATPDRSGDRPPAGVAAGAGGSGGAPPWQAPSERHPPPPVSPNGASRRPAPDPRTVAGSAVESPPEPPVALVTTSRPDVAQPDAAGPPRAGVPDLAPAQRARVVGLNSDGLAQRRRTVPRVPAPRTGAHDGTGSPDTAQAGPFVGPPGAGVPVAGAMPEAARPVSPAVDLPAAAGHQARITVTASPAAVTPAAASPAGASPAAVTPAAVTPAGASPAAVTPAAVTARRPVPGPLPMAGPGPSAVPAEGAAVPAGPGAAGLPRRVRQASLMPQLRRPAPQPDESPSARTPEQVRNLMSALQAGTNRGRMAAGGFSPAPVAADPGLRGPAPASRAAGPGEPPSATIPTWADAATATLPVMRDGAAPDDGVVHHGEVLPRDSGGDSESTPHRTAAVESDHTTTRSAADAQQEKDA